MKYIYFLLLIDTCYSQFERSFWWVPSTTLTFRNKRDLEAKIPPTSPLQKQDVVCCECVKYYLCINGTINTHGTGLIDIRLGGKPLVNVDVCPGELDVCCNVPDADSSCQKLDNKLTSTEPPEIYFTPHPESNCECLSYSACAPQLVVSDGLGKMSIELSNGRMVNHSKCLHALDVCCYLPEFFLGNEIEFNSSTASTPEGETCECVRPYFCTPDGYIRRDGAGISDVRQGPTKPLKKCPTNPDQLCCFPPLQDTNNKKEPSLPFSPTSPTVLPPLPECGQRNAKGAGVRVLGFKVGETQFGEFPWVATLLEMKLIMGVVQPSFLAGASLIHPRVVLTAAHKVDGVPWRNLIVRLGEWDTASEKEFLPHQDINVQRVIFHPRFAKKSLFHDVALLILEEEANQQYNILPICLADSLNNIDTSSCVVNGWGNNAFNNWQYQRIMKSISLPLVRRTQCEALLRRTKIKEYSTLHPSFICAGGQKGINGCKGDGGGPLACQRLDDPTKYLQVGITAWGISCRTKKATVVYADVTYHYNWIINKINRLFPDSTNQTPGGYFFNSRIRN